MIFIKTSCLYTGWWFFLCTYLRFEDEPASWSKLCYPWNFLVILTRKPSPAVLGRFWSRHSWDSNHRFQSEVYRSIRWAIHPEMGPEIRKAWSIRIRWRSSVDVPAFDIPFEQFFRWTRFGSPLHSDWSAPVTGVGRCSRRVATGVSVRGSIPVCNEELANTQRQDKVGGLKAVLHQTVVVENSVVHTTLFSRPWHLTEHETSPSAPPFPPDNSYCDSNPSHQFNSYIVCDCHSLNWHYQTTQSC